RKTNQISKVKKNRFVKNWKLTSHLLVTELNSGNFINPLRCSSIADQLYKKWKRQQIFLLVIFLFVFIFILFGNNIVFKPENSFKFLLCLVSIFLFNLLNLYSLLTKEMLCERNEFFSFVYVDSLSFIRPLSLIALASLLIHYQSLEDIQFTYQQFGAIVENVKQGEYWRLFSGVFVHSGLKHWFLNFSLLFMIYPMLNVNLGIKSIVILICGALFSHISYFLLQIAGLHDGELLLGISGGFFSVLASLTTLSFCCRHLYPDRFFIVTASLSILFLFLGKAINPKVSMIAHISGYIFGIIAILLILKIRREETNFFKFKN
ncbi:MAG: rhomboid family intramembrane serine protease, partial [Pseudomonadota bacterium]